MGSDAWSRGGERTVLSGAGDGPVTRGSDGTRGRQLWGIFGSLREPAKGPSGTAAFNARARQVSGGRIVERWDRPALGVETESVGPQESSRSAGQRLCHRAIDRDRKSTRLNSSHLGISYAVFCL